MQPDGIFSVLLSPLHWSDIGDQGQSSNRRQALKAGMCQIKGRGLKRFAREWPPCKHAAPVADVLINKVYKFYVMNREILPLPLMSLLVYIFCSGREGKVDCRTEVLLSGRLKSCPAPSIFSYFSQIGV